MRPKAKMLDGLPTILRSPQQHAITPLWCPQRQLINRQAFTPCLFDPGSCGAREAECSYGQLGHGEEADVVCDCADDDEGFGVLGCVGGVSCETGEGDGRAVDAGHEEAAEEDFVEGAVCAAWRVGVSGLYRGEGRREKRRTSEEFVEFHEELEVWVVALWSLAVRGPHMVLVQVDTWIQSASGTSVRRQDYCGNATRQKLYDEGQ